MLDCRLNWRRVGRLERAKECRGIKREQKDHRRRSFFFFSLSVHLSLSRGFSPLILRPRAEHETDIFVLILSQLFSYILLPLLATSVSFLLGQSPKLFVTHCISSSSFNQALPSIRLLLFRSHAQRTSRGWEREREREGRKYFRNAARENPFRSFVTCVLLLLIKRRLRWIVY